MCVCCAGVDETDLEVIVPDTSAERDLSNIASAYIPHCFDCLKHRSAGLSTAQLGAMAVALLLVAPMSGSALLHMSSASALFGAGFVVAAIIVANYVSRRRLIKAGCAGNRQAFTFLAPCASNITTVRFENAQFAQAFRELNRVVERGRMEW